MTPLEYGFTPEDLLIVNGRNLLDPNNLLYMAVGVHKSVRFVSGPSGSGACALVVESESHALRE